jgi:uncharacterized protein (DUF488 family)
MKKTFYTIGHSTRSFDEFVKMLKDSGVDVLVDVRSFPRSRTVPQYNIDTLPEELAQVGIGYIHIPELGGRRGRNKAISPDVNGFWQNQSFHNYADYAMGEGFQVGLEKLCQLGNNQTCAIMCAESTWWKCHRRIITDYLLEADKKVKHILDQEKVESAHITSGAHTTGTGIVTYPGQVKIKS